MNSMFLILLFGRHLVLIRFLVKTLIQIYYKIKKDLKIGGWRMLQWMLADNLESRLSKNELKFAQDKKYILKKSRKKITQRQLKAKYY